MGLLQVGILRMRKTLVKFSALVFLISLIHIFALHFALCLNRQQLE